MFVIKPYNLASLALRRSFTSMLMVLNGKSEGHIHMSTAIHCGILARNIWQEI